MKQQIRKIYSLCIAGMLSAGLLNAQAPAGYYDTADSLQEEALRIALREIIKGHTVKSYNDLWRGYQSADMHPDGYIWDIYSHNPAGSQYYTYTYRNDQCGNYSKEGDCYNREHTWPQSMFGDATPMRTDIVLVLPTDGYVNGKRSNYPYGEVSSPSWTSRNGGKLGPNRYPGAPNGTAFEPIDEYKGDIARIMFYVVTRYYKLDSGWSNWEQGNKADLRDWAKDMFLEWHYADPVSDKERNRNNAIYDFQGNRNPYVDRPEFVDCVFNPVNCPWKDGGVDTGGGTGISNLLTGREVSIYPNPATDDIHILINSSRVAGPVTGEVLNPLGQVVLSFSIPLNEQKATLPVNSLNTGVYIIKLYNRELLYTHTFVKQ